jgi:hypothetical protein
VRCSGDDALTGIDLAWGVREVRVGMAWDAACPREDERGGHRGYRSKRREHTSGWSRRFSCPFLNSTLAFQKGCADPGKGSARRGIRGIRGGSKVLVSVLTLSLGDGAARLVSGRAV